MSTLAKARQVASQNTAAFNSREHSRRRGNQHSYSQEGEESNMLTLEEGRKVITYSRGGEKSKHSNAAPKSEQLAPLALDVTETSHKSQEQYRPLVKLLNLRNQ